MRCSPRRRGLASRIETEPSRDRYSPRRRTASITVDRLVADTIGLRGVARAVVIATGGRSLPKTGSDGLGYDLVRASRSRLHRHDARARAARPRWRAPRVARGRLPVGIAQPARGRADRGASRGLAALDALRHERTSGAEHVASLASRDARRRERRRGRQPLSRRDVRVAGRVVARSGARASPRPGEYRSLDSRAGGDCGRVARRRRHRSRYDDGACRSRGATTAGACARRRTGRGARQPRVWIRRSHGRRHSARRDRSGDDAVARVSRDCIWWGKSSTWTAGWAASTFSGRGHQAGSRGMPWRRRCRDDAGVVADTACGPAPARGPGARRGLWTRTACPVAGRARLDDAGRRSRCRCRARSERGGAGAPAAARRRRPRPRGRRQLPSRPRPTTSSSSSTTCIGRCFRR